MPRSTAQGSALSAHSFLIRAALAATSYFVWAFVLQHFYMVYGVLSEAFLHTIGLFILAQLVTVLFTPYSALQLQNGVRDRMLAGVVLCILSFLTLGFAIFSEESIGIAMIAFAMLFGAYRAMYWTPYRLHATSASMHPAVSSELFIAVMPAIAGSVLLQGPYGASMLLFAGATIIIASIAPLFFISEFYEKFTWSYSQAFAELFDYRNAKIVELAFIEGMQGAALLLLWPLAVFVLLGFSYASLGLVVTATLILAILLRPYHANYLEDRVLLRAVLAASGWLFRLVVATPLSVILVDVYASTSTRPGEYLTLEQGADNGTYIDEYTVLKEIALGLGKICMCFLAIVVIAAYSIPIGLALAFIVSALLAAVRVVITRK